MKKPIKIVEFQISNYSYSKLTCTHMSDKLLVLVVETLIYTLGI